MTISHILKWTLLVWLNAALSFFVAVNSSSEFMEIAGIVTAVFSFVLVYSFIDYELLKTHQTERRARLLWSVCLKMLTQFLPMIELFTGSISVSFVTEHLQINTVFFSTYMITIVDGILLSLIVLVLMPIVGFIRTVYRAQLPAATS